MRILEELWYGNIEPTDFGTSTSPEYRELRRLVDRNETDLRATMTDAQKELFNRYLESVLEYDRMDIAYLRDYLTPAKEFIEKHPDKILWCGEFGTIRHAKLQWRENWMRDMITILRQWDIPYCVWNYLSTPNDGNRFSLVDDDSRMILSEELHKIILGEIT